MSDLLASSSYLVIVLTLLAYQIGLWLQRKCKSALCNPIVIAVIIVILVLKLIGISNGIYQEGSKYLNYLLTPATVCLAIPLHAQLDVLKRDLAAILAGIAAGTATSILVIIAMTGLFQFDHSLYISLLPKSVTTAFGIALSEQVGGMIAMTTAAIILTGILGSLSGQFLARLLKISHPAAQGTAYGTSAHVIGTAKANEISELTGAVSSLSLVIAGVITAIVMPFLINIY